MTRTISSQQGATLAETLIALAVALTLAIAAWPMLRDMHATMIATQTADRLAASLALARSTAANRRMEVLLEPLGDNTALDHGWQLSVPDADADTTDAPFAVVALNERCLGVALRGTGGAAGSQSLRLTAVGYSRSEHGGFFAATFQVSCGHAQRQVRLGAQGRIRICQPGVDTDCD